MLTGPSGRVFVGSSISELAGLAGINAASLETTVVRLNIDAARGVDSQFLKPADFLMSIRKPPFYAVLLRPSVVGTTHTGLRCDRSAHVLGHDGLPIPGLFAAGEIMGNVVGERYVGGGNAIANAITFGRIAGQNAAKEARSLQS